MSVSSSKNRSKLLICSLLLFRHTVCLVHHLWNYHYITFDQFHFITVSKCQGTQTTLASSNFNFLSSIFFISFIQRNSTIHPNDLIMLISVLSNFTLGSTFIATYKTYMMYILCAKEYKNHTKNTACNWTKPHCNNGGTHQSLVHCHSFVSAATFVRASSVSVSSSPSPGWRCFAWSLSLAQLRTAAWRCSPCCWPAVAVLPSHASSALSSRGVTVDARDQVPVLQCWLRRQDHSTILTRLKRNKSE